MSKRNTILTKIVKNYLSLSHSSSSQNLYNQLQRRHQCSLPQQPHRYHRPLLLPNLSARATCATAATLLSPLHDFDSFFPRQQQQQHQQQRLVSYFIAANTAAVVASSPQHLPDNCQRKNSSNVQYPSLNSHRSLSKFQPDHPVHHALTGNLTEQGAKELISKLKDSERLAIKNALERYEALKMKENFEGHLAATQWRTRFGRLSRIPSLGEVDPTGSYCAFPEDWLKKKAAEKALPPASMDLWKIFLVNAVPFLGFGFLDNFAMIVAGDYIENLFSFMCISTMAAAGLGNTISDVLGIGTAVYVERGCEMMGLRPPDLTPVQMEMKTSRRYANFGRVIGIVVGCLLGMTPLLFLDEKKC